MNLDKLSEILQTEPKFRFKQAQQAIWQDFVSTWSEVSNFPKELREKLNKECPLEIETELEIGKGKRSSLKALIVLNDGEKIETVLIRHRDGRNTVCLSTQVGCPLACRFCATGQFGFRRNLKMMEIIEQVVFWARYLKNLPPEEKISNLVFMGMGEPFLNYSELIKAIKFLNNPETFNIGARRISVSTVGIVEGIKKLAGEKLSINLAISLHAPTDRLRQELMPIASKYSLYEIFKMADYYIKQTGRKVMFEYLMIKGVNDGVEEAEQLVKLIKNPLYLINLIPCNPIGDLKPSKPEKIKRFKEILERAKINVTVRTSFGSEILAACGQLRARK